MKALSKKWKVFAIHHSHTDIGYTERQELIEAYHVGFIKQAIQIAKDIQSGKRKNWEGFKWTCETFWAVERFLEQASVEEKQDFAEAISQGYIELSGTYLNMTELADYDLLQTINRKAAQYGESIGTKVDSAMTADINGYSWGYAQTLVDADIKHLFSCVHTHHGMFPLGRKQIPFWWETPKGDRLLVWNGDHYHIGNVLGLCPDAMLSYIVQDEFSSPQSEAEHKKIMKTRIQRYLLQLEKEEYPFDFVPIMVSGLKTDNGSPNGRIMDTINEWNAENGDQVEIEMTTLSDFFQHLKQSEVEIPVHQGDWPDWWSDGVSSTAMYTQMYRDAQRTLRKVKQLDPKHEIISKKEIEDIEYQLVLYAEHTWGYHSSVVEPWHLNVQKLEVRKTAYAANANRLAYRALDKITLEKGGVLLYPDRPLQYRLINTEQNNSKQIVSLGFDGWENTLLKDGFEVVDLSNGEIIPHQQEVGANAISIEIQIDPGKEKDVKIRPTTSEAIGRTTNNFKLQGSDSVYDISDMYENGGEVEPINFSQHSIESPFAKISWNEDGIYSWINKETNMDMVRDDQEHGAFTPVYEVTPAAVPNDRFSIAQTRRKMGRNRKGINVQTSVGRLHNVREITRGPLFGIVELQFECEGMSYYSIFLKVYATVNRVDISVRLHKESVWDPENVYISLPFTTGNQSEDTLWIEKAGAVVRPWVDQLPGTLLDYYCIQEGLSYINGNQSLTISLPDTPLLQLGSLNYGKRLVHSQQDSNPNPNLYAWILSNYWETNFKATLGGFYEFKYYVAWDNNASTPEKAISLSHSMNAGLTAFRIGE